MDPTIQLTIFHHFPILPMEWNLKNLAINNPEVFLDALNLQLLRKSKGGSGELRCTDDGNTESIRWDNFVSGDEMNVPLRWCLTQNQKGDLLQLVVQQENGNLDSAIEKELEEFIQHALNEASAIVNRDFVIVSFLYYIGVQLDGEYEFPGFTLAPAVWDDPYPILANTERVLKLEIPVSAKSHSEANAKAIFITRQAAARLSLLLNIGIYESDFTNRWVKPKGEHGYYINKCERHELGFSPPYFISEKDPLSADQKTKGQFAGGLDANYMMLFDYRMSLPSESKQIFQTLHEDTNPRVKAFDMAARLTQVALVGGRQFSSVELSYKVAAIEAITQHDEKWSGKKPSEDFKTFMTAHLPTDPALTKIVNQLYGKLRSAHFHAGSFALGEFDPPIPYGTAFMNPQFTQRMQFKRDCLTALRTAIVEWIRRSFLEPEAKSVE